MFAGCVHLWIMRVLPAYRIPHRMLLQLITVLLSRTIQPTRLYMVSTNVGVLFVEIVHDGVP